MASTLLLPIFSRSKKDSLFSNMILRRLILMLPWTSCLLIVVNADMAIAILFLAFSERSSERFSSAPEMTEIHSMFSNLNFCYMYNVINCCLFLSSYHIEFVYIMCACLFFFPSRNTMQLENVFGSSPGEEMLKDHFFIFLTISLAVTWPGFLNDGWDEFPKLPVNFPPLKEFSLRLILHIRYINNKHYGASLKQICYRYCVYIYENSLLIAY